ncbi:DNA-3-methyladenine glycosylase family protein [Chloroflexota bacterium]
MLSNPQYRSDINIATDILVNCDPRLAEIISALGPCTLERREQGFISLVRSIVSQQLSKWAAQSIQHKLESLFDKNGINPERFLEIQEEELLKTGLSRPKVKYIKGLASYALSDEINFNELESQDDEDVIQKLTQIKGIGRWTAEMYLMFSLNRLDVFPLDDAAIRNAMTDIYDISKDNFENQALNIAERWRPYRTIACWYLYRYINSQRGS